MTASRTISTPGIRRSVARATRRAFSLIELLVVITIIAIVISITVPAISFGRDAARAQATRAQVQSLTSAVSAFQLDEDRVPGYFPAAVMAEDNNRGFTGMQNVILDLAGGPIPQDGNEPASAVLVGPNSSDGQVLVNPALFGVDSANNTSYLDVTSLQFGTIGGKSIADADNDQIPGILDSWDMPLLAWSENEFAPEIDDIEQPDIENFAAVDGSALPARFYWNQNEAVLDSTGLGERQVSQRESALVSKRGGGSLTGLSDEEKADALAALAGSTAGVTTRTRRGITSTNVSTLVPSASKGSVIFQSAGRDRVFLSTDESAYDEITGQLIYSRNFSPSDSGRFGDDGWPNADGDDGIVDVVSRFNDIVLAATR